ncbi:hypothetical protein ERO13_D05G302276v2 [Gossypium hirsutum]|nr:hypothetical protein ERO13_D05G302276v2 [Gossypium hirsutum]
MGITFQGLTEYKESLSGKNKHKAAVVEENQNPNIVVVEGERGGGSLALEFLYCVLASSVPPGSSSVKWGKSCDQNHITLRNKENEEVMVSTVELVDDISKKIDSFVGLIKDNINDSMKLQEEQRKDLINQVRCQNCLFGFSFLCYSFG